MLKRINQTGDSGLRRIHLEICTPEEISAWDVFARTERGVGKMCWIGLDWIGLNGVDIGVFAARQKKKKKR